MQSFLTQTLFYLGAAVISVPIAKRLGLGSVLGYLIAGVIIGPHALSLIGAQADVMQFAEFGVVILLFLIGLEVQPSTLWDMRKAIFGLGGAQVVGTALSVAGVSMLLGLPWQTALAVGLVLAMSSTAIVLQTLDEKGLRQGPVGRAAFGVLLLQDLAVIPMFALLPLLATIAAPAHGDAGGHGASLVSHLPIWAQGLSVFAAVGAVVGGGRYLVRPLFRFIAKARLREIFTASALLIVVGVASLMQMVGLSPALGAFLAGVVLAESEFRRELETDIEPFRGLLLGLFFITVGAGVDLPLIASQPLTLIGLVLGLMVLKFLVMLGLARLFGAPLRGAAAVATALAELLGAADFSFHGLPDNRFDTLPLLDVIKIVEELVDRVRPGDVIVADGDGVEDGQWQDAVAVGGARLDPGEELVIAGGILARAVALTERADKHPLVDAARGSGNGHVTQAFSPGQGGTAMLRQAVRGSLRVSCVSRAISSAVGSSRVCQVSEGTAALSGSPRSRRAASIRAKRRRMRARPVATSEAKRLRRSSAVPVAGGGAGSIRSAAKMRRVSSRLSRSLKRRRAASRKIAGPASSRRLMCWIIQSVAAVRRDNKIWPRSFSGERT